MSENQKKSFYDELASIVDGDTDAIDRHLSLLSEDEECRDLRHDAEAITGDLRALATGYTHRADFVDRLLACVDAQSTSETPAPSEAPRARLSDLAEPVKPATPEVASLADQPRRKSAPARKQASPKAGRTLAVRRRLWAASALAVAAAAALWLGIRGDSQRSEVSAPGNHLLSATVIEIQRTASDGAAGLRVRASGAADFAVAQAGAEIANGAVLETDGRTRALLRLSDGSEVTMAPASSLALSAEEVRAVRLDRGQLVAEVAHLEDAPKARYFVPGGAVQVLGTRFALSADDGDSSVRVLRGAVAFGPASGDTVEVRAGEEGMLDARGSLAVAPAVHLVESLRWAELEGTELEERGGSGLGELRAYKPGETRDRDWPMALASHKVTVRIVGNVARTEIEETFRNDSDTVLEGVYKFPLPGDAQIDTLALDVDGRFEEGAFVERDRAAKIWRGVIANATPEEKRPREEIIWVAGPWRDPALLEWQKGNRFDLRIFPIPARGSRTIKLSYTENIAPQGHRRRYVYPLPRSADGSSVAERFEVDAQVSGVDEDSSLHTPGYDFSGDTGHAARSTRTLSLSANGFVPNGDLVIDYQTKSADAELRSWTFEGNAVARAAAAQAGKDGPSPAALAEQTRLAADPRAYALLALRPNLPRWNDVKPRDFAVVIDSSQSMTGENYARSVRAIAAFVAEMEARDRVHILACDVECVSFADEPVRGGKASAEKVGQWLGERTQGGASFLEQTLATAAARLGQGAQADRERWVMYVGDGVATVGHRKLATLDAIARELRARHDVSLTTIGVGADADSRTLSTIARAGGGFYVPHRPGRSPERIAMAMHETTLGVALRDATVSVPSALGDVSARELPTLRAGDEYLLTARFSGQAEGEVILRGTVGGKPFEKRYDLAIEPTRNRANGFVPRMWATQTIDSLERSGRPADRDRIVALSKGYGVMSRHTSLLVLESEAMFRAFAVDRTQSEVRWTGEEGEAEMTGVGGLVGDASSSVLPGKGAGGGYGSLGPARAESKNEVTTRKKRAHEEHTRAASSPRSSADNQVADRGLLDLDEQMPLEQIAMQGMRGRGGRYMRRIWRQVPELHDYDGVHENIHRAVEDAERALAESPDSRDRHRDLLQALAYAEDLDRAEEVAYAWLERDRLDAEALGYLADVAARRGQRQESLRVLSGVVDLQPDDLALHRRMAKAYQRLGDRELACAHLVVLAELESDEIAAVADAVRCESESGRSARADELVEGTELALRGRVRQRAQQPASFEQVRGDAVLEGRWTGGGDLDIAIITPTGQRISWQGGNKNVVAEDVSSHDGERLALTRVRRGNYLIEVSRADASDTRPIHGRVDVTLLGARRSFAIHLDGRRQVIGRLAVRMRPELVPL